MLEELKILNGAMDLKFNEYIYEYTASVDNDIESLEIEYKIKDGCKIDIQNNNLEEGNNIIYINVYNSNSALTYTLYVYKEESNTASALDTYMSNLVVNNNDKIAVYKVQILCISIFIIILAIYCFMFRKKKNLK